MLAPRLSLRRPATPWLLLAAILAAHALANYLWVSEDRTLRSFDMGPHIEYQANAHAVVVDEGLGGVLRVARGDRAQIWPSAGYLPWVGLSLLFGTGLNQVRMFNVLYLALLMTALFLLGRRIHSSRAGLLAAALVTLYPLIYGDSRQFGIDLPGAACATLCIYLMLCTERLSRPWRSVGLGAACGAGLLVCPRIALFLIPPAICLLLASLYAPRGTTRLRVLLHAALGLAAAGLTSACWWWGRLADMAIILTEHQQGLGARMPEPSAWYYLKVHPWAFSFYLLLIAALALFVLVHRRGGLLDPDRLLLVLCWLVPGLLVLSSIKIHHLRHMLPLVPAVALLTAVGVSLISRRSLRRFVTGLALGVGVFSWLVDSFVSQVDHGWPGLDKATHTPTLVADLEITSGPPQRDNIVVATEAVGRALSEWHHGSGQGLVVRIEGGRPTDPWRVRPVLSTTVPGLFFINASFRDLRHERGDCYLGIWGSSVACSAGLPRRCYHLVIDACPTGDLCHHTRPQADGAAVQELLARRDGNVRVTLWRRARCLNAPNKAPPPHGAAPARRPGKNP